MCGARGERTGRSDPGSGRGGNPDEHAGHFRVARRDASGRFGRRDEVSNRIWVAIVLTLVGLAMVAQVWDGMTLDPVGVLAGLLCAVALAVYWLLGESGQEKRDAVSLTMWGFIFASCAWAVISP